MHADGCNLGGMLRNVPHLLGTGAALPLSLSLTMPLTVPQGPAKLTEHQEPEDFSGRIM